MGHWGIAGKKTFYVYDTQLHTIGSTARQIINAEYFYDNDPGYGKGINIPIIRGELIDVERYLRLTNLVEGNHTLYIRVKDESDRWSLYKDVAFHVDTSLCTKPIVDFTNDTATFGTPVTFTNLTTNALPEAKYKWDFNNDGITDDSTLNITHSFPAPGIYPVKLTVENSTSCGASIIKDLVTGPLPDTTLIINGNLTFCEGDSVILTSANNPPGYSFTWSNGDTTQAITIKSSGSYYVWITNNYGLFTKSSVIQVVVHEVPTASIAVANATGGTSNGMISLTVSGGSGNYSYLWTNGATTPILINLPAGAYSVTVNDGQCPIIIPTAIVNIPVDPGDIIKAEYFFDTDPGTGNATALQIRAGESIEFPASLPLTGLLPGYHYIYIRTCNTDGIWGIALRKSFHIYDSSPITPSPDQPPITQADYYIGNDPGVGKGIPIQVSSSDSLSLTRGITTVGIPLGFHTIYLRTKDALGRWSLHSRTPFFVYDSVPKHLAHNCKSILKAEYFFDTDPGTENGTSITFNTNDSVNVNRFLPISGLVDGNHILYIRSMDETGQWSLWKRDSFTVQHADCSCPVVDFNADTVQTIGLATQFTNLSTGAMPEALYEWDIDNNNVIDYTTPNVSHNYNQFGIYEAKLTIRNSDSCFASFIREVVVSPAIDTSIIINGNLTFCSGDSVIIAAMPGYFYNWNNGATSQSITVNRSGSYSLRLTNQYGVQAHSRTVNVLVNITPEVFVKTIDASGGNANGTAICVVNGDPASFIYIWSTEGNLPVQNNLAEGDYWVTVTDGKCPVTRNFHISNKVIYPGDIVDAEYFYDTDPGVGNGLALNISGGSSMEFETYIPVTNLPVGYHNLYIRVRDTYNTWSLYLNKLFYVYENGGNVANNRPPISGAEYFFDHDPGVGNGHPVSINSSDEVNVDCIIDVQGLATGYHSMSLRAMDIAGNWSLVRTHNIYVYDSVHENVSYDQSKIVALEYFYDTDPGVGKGMNIPFTPTSNLVEINQFFPVTGLVPGTHHVYVRAKDEAGEWGIYRNEEFSVEAVACNCPVPSFITDTVNQGFSTTFENNSGNTNGETSYEWDINDDGSVEFTTRNISYLFPLTGVYNVKLRVINSGICQASLIRQVYVGPIPDNTIAVNGNLTFCEGDSVVLSASQGFTYKWWPGGETTSSIVVKNSGSYYAWISNATGIEIKSEAVKTVMHQGLSTHLTIANASGGNSNGSAFIEVPGGSGSYSYFWSSGSQTNYANSLSAGNYSVTVNDGYCPVTENFEIENLPVNEGDIIAAEYFFNTDPGVGHGIPIVISSGETIEHITGLPVAGLPNGFNRLYIRGADTEGSWSLYREMDFFVFDTAVNRKSVVQPPIAIVEYFMDLNQPVNLDPGVGNGTMIDYPDADSISASFDYNADDLALGFHNINIRAKDESDSWGHLRSSKFFVYDTTHYDLVKIQPAIVAAEYFFDTDPGAGNAIPLSVASGDQVIWNGGFGIGSLNLGPHYIYIRTMDANNKWSIPKRMGFGIYDCVQPTANFNFNQSCINNPVVFQDHSINVAENATYEWDIDNDGSIDYTTHGSISHKFDVPGSHEIKLKITHNVACIDSIIETILFQDVQLGNDTAIYTDQSVVLDAGAGFVTYDWSNDSVNQTITVNGADLGPGSYSYEVNVSTAIGCIITDSIDVLIILPPRDLVISNTTATSDTLLSGSQTTVSYQLSNTGTISAIVSTIGYYLSTDPFKSSEDIFISNEIAPSLEAGAIIQYSKTITIPTVADGLWYLLVVADDNFVVTESNESNNVGIIEIQVNSGNSSKNLQLHVLLQGLYAGNGLMHKAQNSFGDQFSGTIADLITIELHNANNYSNIVYSESDVNLGTNGIAEITFPPFINGTYYVTIKHRNSITTTTQSPISFTGSTIIYDFNDPLKAYGGNLFTLDDGNYAIYSGDVNQDGSLSQADMVLVFEESSLFTSGYVATDLNGDGVIDALDMIILDNNISNFVSAITP